MAKSTSSFQQQQHQQQDSFVVASHSAAVDDSSAFSNLVATEPEVLVVHPPGDDTRVRRSDYVVRSHIETEISNVPQLSETGTNPQKKYDLQATGMYHSEGGWPRDCDATDPEHRLRHLRRTRKEANFLSTVRELASRSIPVLSSNNALDIYHSMWSDIVVEGRLGEGLHSTPSLDFLKLRYSSASLNSSRNMNNNSINNSNRNISGGNNHHHHSDKQNGVFGGDDGADLMHDTTAAAAAAGRGGHGGDEHDGDADADRSDGDHHLDDDDDDVEGDVDSEPNAASRNNSGVKSKSKSASNKRKHLRRERELAAKRAQQHVEDLQVACLAARTVGINATGVFRDAPRAFPADLLGGDVKDLVRTEQRRIQEQANLEASQEALQLATKAMLSRQLEVEDEDDDMSSMMTRQRSGGAVDGGGGDDSDNDGARDNVLARTQKNSSVSSSRKHDQNPSLQVPGSSSSFGSSGSNVKIGSDPLLASPQGGGGSGGSGGFAAAASFPAGSNRRVVLGPSATFSEPKVVSSLSWVTNLEIPHQQQQQRVFLSHASSSLAPSSIGGGGGGVAGGTTTTLAIALASVQNTPHLALLGSRAKSEVVRASKFFMSQFSSGSDAASARDVHVSGKTTTKPMAATVKNREAGAQNNSNRNDVTMCGVDLFPTSLIYDAAAPQAPLMRLKTASDLIQLEFSPRDAPLLASGSSDGTISLFDLRRGATRCLIVADVCNSTATVLSAVASASSSAAAPNVANLSPRLPSGYQHHHHHHNHHSSSSIGSASFRRNPLNPVCALRWVPSGTGARCTEFATADLSPVVRIWDTRFVSRGCLDTFNLNSGVARAAIQELEIKTKARDRRSGGNDDDEYDDDDYDYDEGIIGEEGRARKIGDYNVGDTGRSRQATDTSPDLLSSSSSPSYYHFSPVKAISIDVQTVSGRVYIGTTDGKVFAFSRKGRTDSDRLCGVFQVVPKEQTRYFTSTATSMFQISMASSSSLSSFSSTGIFSPDHNIQDQRQQQHQQQSHFLSLDVYVHIAAHPTLPRCFATATEWGVSVFADDLPDPVATLPASPHGVPTSIRWVPHCAALLCVSRLSGVVELWDVCVMLTSPVLMNSSSSAGGGAFDAGSLGSGSDQVYHRHRQDSSTAAGGGSQFILGGGSQPKASATIMEYSGPGGFFSSAHSSSTSATSHHQPHHHYSTSNTNIPKIVTEYGEQRKTATTNVNKFVTVTTATATPMSFPGAITGSGPSPPPPISSLRFSPDGSSLVAGLLDGSTTLLDVTIRDDENMVKAAEDIQMSPALLMPSSGTAAAAAAVAATGGGGGSPSPSSSSSFKYGSATSMVPQILGARALEFACFSRIVEKRGVQRTKRMLRLLQQSAPDVTTSSTLHYSARASSLHSKTEDESAASKTRETTQPHEPQQHEATASTTIPHFNANGIPSMTHDKLTLDMAKLSHHFQSLMASSADLSTTATTTLNEYNHPSSSAAPPPPFKSSDAAARVVMDRVSNLLYNPMMNSNDNSNRGNAVSIDYSSSGNNNNANAYTSASLSSAASPVSSKSRLRPLSAPLAEDHAAVQQLARAVETGAALPPENIDPVTGAPIESSSIHGRGARRWSTVRRHLMPKAKSDAERELDQYRNGGAGGVRSSSPPFSYSPFSHLQQPSGVFVPADEQLSGLAKFGQNTQAEFSRRDDERGATTGAAASSATPIFIPRRPRATAFKLDDNNTNDKSEL